MRHLVSLFRVDGNETTILPRYVAVIQAILLKRAMQDVPFKDSGLLVDMDIRLGDITGYGVIILSPFP